MVRFISPTTVLVTSALVLVVHAQYFRPYPMAMDHGFSPYHPARINQETLPISQAEFAQLVAESMATSNGPHHHHPPNTDQDYEGPAHAMRDTEMQRHPHAGHHGGGAGHAHAHHDPNHHHHYDDQPQVHHHGGGGGGGVSQYQPEDNYRSHHEADSEHEDNSYHRSPVYENSYHGDEEADDQLENPPEHAAAQYGGRPGTNHHEAMNHQYEPQYDHPHHMHHQAGGGHHHHQHQQPDEGDAESRLRPVQHYMPANEPATIVKLVHLPM